MLLYWILLPIVWVLAHILWRFEVIGRENLKSVQDGRPYVIAANHIANLDPVFILIEVFSWRRLYIPAKEELFKNPLIGWFLSCMGAVPIDRGKGDMGTVNKVTDECKNGTPILIFPEGTRSKTGERGDGGEDVQVFTGHAGYCTTSTTASRTEMAVLSRCYLCYTANHEHKASHYRGRRRGGRRVRGGLAARAVLQQPARGHGPWDGLAEGDGPVSLHAPRELPPEGLPRQRGLRLEPLRAVFRRLPLGERARLRAP